MEKIKDFFHDFSDIFFAIAITGAIFVVLSLNLGSWFNNSSNIVSADENIQIVENNTNPQSENDNKEVDEEIEKEDINKDKTPTEEREENDELNSNENESKPENITNVETKTIVIPNGTPGSGVARILKENGLINDTKDFIQTAENLNLAIRLKSGSFNIPSNSTIEDMVKIIAGQKK